MPSLSGRHFVLPLLLVFWSGPFRSTNDGAIGADDKPPRSEQGETTTNESADRLLATLRKQNSGRDTYHDPWCRTLKEIVDLGPDAVPSLIRELDATDDNTMLRCLGFMLRAIGDKRAVPALIRAIPKTLQPPGSDVGLSTNDPELLKFAQKHDLDENNQGTDYGVGRPVREICGALRVLTGKDHGETDLYHVILGGSESQQQLKRRLYHQVARRWADWWIEEGDPAAADKRRAELSLPAVKEVEDIPPPALDSHFRTGGGSSNWLLESVRNPRAQVVFYDFDIGRAAALPDRWKEGGDIEAREKEIVLWAVLEGFDLMGTEYQSADGKTAFALRSLGMHTWELPPSRWKVGEKDVTLKTLQEMGRPAGPYLLSRPAESDNFVLEDRASFLFITRHGTPGLLFVGIEVRDDSLKRGERYTGDHELNPVSFGKGRRFGFSSLEQIAQ